MTTNVDTSSSERLTIRVASGRMWTWLATDVAARWLLALILIVAAYLRLSHVNWDQGWHIHPDERFLTMVLSGMSLPQSLGQFLDSTQSPMNPSNAGYGFFVYGTLPLFVVRVIAEFAQKLNGATHLWEIAPGVLRGMVGYDGVQLVGRAVSGLFDLATVGLVFVVGRRLYSRKVGLLAAAFYAFAVLPLQQSHFFTVDTFGTFFALLTFYFAVRVAQGGSRDDGAAAGAPIWRWAPAWAPPLHAASTSCRWLASYYWRPASGRGTTGAACTPSAERARACC